jgi:hypothetical protein
MGDPKLDQVCRRCRRAELGFLAVLVPCFAAAIIARFAWSVELMETPGVIRAVLGATLFAAGLCMLFWCKSYATYTVERKIKPYRKFFESVYPRYLRRMYYSRTFNVILSIFGGLMFGFIGMSLLLVARPN